MPMPALHERLVALAGLFALALFGLAFGLLGQLGIEEPADKMVHAVFFALAATGLFFLFGRRALLAAVTALLIGLFGEIAQGFVGSHTVSAADFLANGAGILVMVGVVLPTTGNRRRRRRIARRLAEATRDLPQAWLRPAARSADPTRR